MNFRMPQLNKLYGLRRIATAVDVAKTYNINIARAQGCRQGFTGAIGNTPLILLDGISRETNCKIYGKAEFMNPGGSVKDRAALYLVGEAEKAGKLKRGGTVVEGTAGNTGIGLAHVCRAKGYKCVIFMPNNQSIGKVNLLRLLGATVYLVPALPYEDPNNYNHQAERYAASLEGGIWTNQFDNTANRLAHIETTGPEIWTQTRGLLDVFTCATGTGGTLAGITRYLKEVSDGRTECWLADPPGSVLHSYLVSKGKLQRREGNSITEGIGQGRITKNLACDINLLNGSLAIPDSTTISMLYRMLDEEGLYVGASTALNIAAAYQLALNLGPGKTIVTILCDGAHRYAERLFSKSWLQEKKLKQAIPSQLQKYIVLD